MGGRASNFLIMDNYQYALKLLTKVEGKAVPVGRAAGRAAAATVVAPKQER